MLFSKWWPPVWGFAGGVCNASRLRGALLFFKRPTSIDFKKLHTGIFPKGYGKSRLSARIKSQIHYIANDQRRISYEFGNFDAAKYQLMEPLTATATIRLLKIYYRSTADTQYFSLLCRGMENLPLVVLGVCVPILWTRTQGTTRRILHSTQEKRRALPVYCGADNKAKLSAKSRPLLTAL